MTYNFAGKVALVTGAGGEQGIGRAIATRLAREGADVVVTDYMANPKNSTSWAGLPDVVREIEELGGKALAILGDVSQAGDVEEIVRQTLRSFGQIDILVNNAGTAAGEDRVPLVELKEEEWDRVQRVNAKGTFLCCKTVARVMIKQGRGGKILNMSSLSGKFGAANFGAYCASKFAVRGLTQSLAKELGPHGIQVHALCPGMILTERYTDIAEATAPDGVSTADHLEEIKKRALSGTPLRRIGTPRDVARTAAYLVSSESDFLIGLSITIDGGVLMD